jgi:thiol:disulfide interchange protein
MALPYAVLSAFPSLVNRMPKTGPASELLKQVMGGLMLAAAAFFIGSGLSGATVAPPDPPSLLYWWFVFGIVALVGGWLAWRTFALTRSPGRRLVFAGAGAVLLLAAPALAMRITDRGPIRWTYYTPERFEQARASGDAVVLDFTAEWCLNCKSLEAGVLHRDEVASLLNAPGVRPIKVDLTGKNRDGNERLRATGRVAIPLLVIYGRDGSEVFKSDFYTKEQVIQALRRATGP